MPQFITDNTNGFVVPFEDTTKLRKAVLQIPSSDELRKKVSFK